jgi:hypothetical protein
MEKHVTLAWFEPSDGTRHPRGAIRYSSALKDVPLLTPSQDGPRQPRPLVAYPFYVSLRKQKAWRCPEMIGHIPARVDDTSTPRQKGELGLFIMLLFRPYRSFEKDVLGPALAHLSHGDSTDASAYWTAVYESYLAWRSSIEHIAKPILQAGDDTALAPGPPALTRPFSDHGLSPTTRWWACVIYLKLRNFDLVLWRHTARCRICLHLNTSRLSTYALCDAFSDSCPYVRTGFGF